MRFPLKRPAGGFPLRRRALLVRRLLPALASMLLAVPVLLIPGVSAAAGNSLAPTLNSARPSPTGGVLITWTDRSDNEDAFYITRRGADGSHGYVPGGDMPTKDTSGVNGVYTHVDPAPTQTNQCYKVMSYDYSGLFTSSSPEVCVEGGVYTWGNCLTGDCAANVRAVPQLPNGIRQIVIKPPAISAGFRNLCDTLADPNRAFPCGEFEDELDKTGVDYLAQMADGSWKTWTAASGPQSAQPVTNLQNVVQIQFGYSGAKIALKADGTVWGWGDPSALGQVAPAGWDENIPLRIEALSGIKQITVETLANVGKFYALRNDGTVWYWGYSQRDQTTSSAKVTHQAGLSGIVQLSSGGYTLALDSSGTVWGWGYNHYGAAGPRSGAVPLRLETKTPQKIPGLPAGVTEIAAGFSTSYAIAGADRSVWAWGSEGLKQDGAFAKQGFTTSREVDCDGSILDLGFCWPEDYADDYEADVDGKARRTGLTGAVQITATWLEAGVVLADGTVWEFSPRYPFGGALIPHQVMGISGVKQIAMGFTGAMAIGTPTVAVPDLTGMSRTQATTALQNAGLVRGAVGSEFDPTCSYIGKVSSQSPEADAQIPNGSAVKIWIGQGPPPPGPGEPPVQCK